MKNSEELLQFALEKYPERVEAVPLEDLLVDSARSNAKRPAYVKLTVPDEVVKELRGSAAQRSHLLFLVRVPKDVVDRSESAIILPNEI